MQQYFQLLDEHLEDLFIALLPLVNAPDLGPIVPFYIT